MPESDARLAKATFSSADDPSLPHEAATGYWRRRVTWISILGVLLAAALVLPPLVNIGTYKRQITSLMSQSLGRPVRASRVELRLLPMPGFVLHDLSVGEDPRFGAEPILAARTVVASIRVLSLWRGRIEISRVSVDEASLNLVRSPEGPWNLESLIMGAQPALSGGTKKNSRKSSLPLPYLEATDSRVNLKNGGEKTPFSLVDTDLSLWQDAPGQWRVRVHGQPMRTDIPMSLADTGEVRLEANLQAATAGTRTELRDMPLKLDMEWRNAQLGQLSRLVTGSDAGWRGDVTLDVSVLGTPDAALTKARLRATGVRREEFAPATPLDFDANCKFRYQHSSNAAHDINCNTAIGDGRLHLQAELPGSAGPPEAMLEVKDLPLQAGLDLLRTVRVGFAPGMQAKGVVNGSLSYKEAVPEAESKSGKAHSGGSGSAAAAAKATGSHPPATVPAGGNLQGSLTVSGAELTGGELQEPLKFPEVTLTPALLGEAGTPDSADRSALTAHFAIPPAVLPAKAEKTERLTADVQLGVTAQGYQAVLDGTAPLERLRSLAYAFGWPHQPAADGFAEGTSEFNLTARGAWIPAENASGLLQSDGDSAASVSSTFGGTLVLHNAEWRADYLARPVQLSQATVTLAGTGADFEGDFAYGNGQDSARNLLRGSVTIHPPADCASSNLAGAPKEECLPQIELKFGALDAAVMEAALLGAPEEKSLLSSLVDRMRSTDQPKWPPVALRVQADSLLMGPVAWQQPIAEIRFSEGAAVIRHWEAGLFDGTAAGTGRLSWADNKPQYAFEGTFVRLSASPLGALAGGDWATGSVSGSAKVALSGRTAADLAASATGAVAFDWQHGSGLPVAGASFEEWKGKLAIGAGKAVLGDNTLLLRRKTTTLTGAIVFRGAAGPTAAFIDANGTSSAGLPSKQALK